jgi:hypothetical protein
MLLNEPKPFLSYLYHVLWHFYIIDHTYVLLFYLCRLLLTGTKTTGTVKPVKWTPWGARFSVPLIEVLQKLQNYKFLYL